MQFRDLNCICSLTSVARALHEVPLPDVQHVNTPICFCKSPRCTGNELVSVIHAPSSALPLFDKPDLKLGRGPHAVAGAAHWQLRAQRVMTGLSPCCWAECTRAPGRGPTRFHWRQAWHAHHGSVTSPVTGHCICTKHVHSVKGEGSIYRLSVMPSYNPFGPLCIPQDTSLAEWAPAHSWKSAAPDEGVRNLRHEADDSPVQSGAICEVGGAC